MRNVNGFGGVTKLKGKRRKPYMAYVSEMVAQGVVIPPETQKSLQTKMRALESASTAEDINSIYVDLLVELFFASDMTMNEYRDKIVKEAKRKMKEQSFKAKQVKKPIGYFATAPEANIALAEYNKSPYDLNKKTVTFKEVYDLAYEDARIDNKSRSTQKGYSASIKKCAHLFDVPFSEVRHSHLQAVIDENYSLSRSSLRDIVTTYHVMYSYALKNDLIDKNYSEFVKIEEHKEAKEKVPFTREEVQYLWDNLDWEYKTGGKLNGSTIADILLILIYTGVRVNELLSTKAEDVHIEERYIDLRGTKTKAAKRIVPISKKILPLIEKRLAMSGEYLIVNPVGEKLKYHNIDAILEEFTKYSGMKHTFHEARHTFATFTKSSKLEPTLRQFIIGHANNSITDDVYTHPEVLLPELLAEIDKLEI